MAYQNFSELGGPALPAPRAESAEDGAASFTALEWSVVMLARRDRLSSLHEPGRMAVALGAVFGGERYNPRLADPRLEALRRMAVLAWHRSYAVPLAEIRAFHAAGFSEEHYEVLQASISRGRAALKRKN